MSQNQPPKPARVSHTAECSTATVVAQACQDGSIYRAEVTLTMKSKYIRYSKKMSLGDAMALRDVLSKGIHAALSMTADLNMGKR